MRALTEHQKQYEEIKSMSAAVRKGFRIAVCGKFKSGKSSLLNQLLSEDLPVKAVTATGVLTKISYGDHCFVELPDGSRKNVSRKELYEAILVQDKSADGVSLSNVLTANLGSHSPLLKNGAVEFWDTPGLEDDPILTEITMRSLRECDLAVVVFDAAKFGSLKEKRTLEELQQLLGGNLLFVINRIDLLNDREDLEAVSRSAGKILSGYGNRLCGKGTILYTSANPEKPDISRLLYGLNRVCGGRAQMEACKRAAAGGRIQRRLAEWMPVLKRDGEESRQRLEALSALLEKKKAESVKKRRETYSQKQRELKLIYYDTAGRIQNMDGWSQALSGIKSTQNWQSSFPRLAEEQMKKQAQLLIMELFEQVAELVPKEKYRDCYPFPGLKLSGIWDEMTYPAFAPAGGGMGMAAGAAAGAAIGTAVPIVGTVAGGIFGFLAGAYQAGASETVARERFQNTCIPDTLERFQKSAAKKLLEELEHFYGELSGKLKAHFEGAGEEFLEENEALIKEQKQLHRIHSYMEEARRIGRLYGGAP